MNDANEQIVADIVHRELRQLPDRPAPATLVPRVLAALAERRRVPWWRKSWSGWPPSIRLAFLGLSLAIAGGLFTIGLQLPELGELATDISQPVLGWLGALKPYATLAVRLGDAAWLAIKSAPPQMLWLIAAAIGLGYAICVGLGTLGYRVALNRI